MPTLPGQAGVQAVDAWMDEIYQCDPVLPGMVNKLTTAFAGAGWKILGGARLAAKAAYVLENADGGRGWFHFVEACAKSYIMRNAGCFVELARQFAPRVDEATGDLLGELAPVTGIYNMDSSKVRWRAQRAPARAMPISYESKAWGPYDFFHLVDNPGDTDATRHVGQCSRFRCMAYVQLMGLIDAWERGNLDPDFVDALLLLTGTSDEQFGQAMGAREKAIDEKGNAAKRLAVLANVSEEVKAQLLFLRRMPESLSDFEGRIRMIYEVYAMNLGRDVTFWFPSQYSGRSYRTRSEVQSEERQAVESNVFHPKLQEAIQRYVMPESCHFEFANAAVSDRDEQSQLIALAEVAKTLFESRQESAPGVFEYLLSRDEMRLFLAEGHPKFASVSDSDPSPETNDDMAAVRALPAMQRLALAYKRGWRGNEQLMESIWAWDVRRARATSRQRALPWSVADLAGRGVWPLDRTMVPPQAMLPEVMPVWVVGE